MKQSWEQRLSLINRRRLEGHFAYFSSILRDHGTVCIVGNSQSLLEQQKGFEIDSCDLVVRLNRGTEKLEHHTTGLKTSIHLTSSTKTSVGGKAIFLLSSKLSRSWTVLMSPQGHRFKLGPRYHLDLRPFFTFYPPELHKNLVDRLAGHQPSTGAMAIDLILKFAKPEQLHLYGFDFWQSPNRHTLSSIHTNHSAELEKLLAFEILPVANIH